MSDVVQDSHFLVNQRSWQLDQPAGRHVWFSNTAPAGNLRLLDAWRSSSESVEASLQGKGLAPPGTKSETRRSSRWRSALSLNVFKVGAILTLVGFVAQVGTAIAGDVHAMTYAAGMLAIGAMVAVFSALYGRDDDVGSRR